mgnify:CR=1 FL=1
MDLPVGESEYFVKFDYWFFAIDDTTMMNRSYIRKFGLVMAEVAIFMQKQKLLWPRKKHLAVLKTSCDEDSK